MKEQIAISLFFKKRREQIANDRFLKRAILSERVKEQITNLGKSPPKIDIKLSFWGYINLFFLFLGTKAVDQHQNAGVHYCIFNYLVRAQERPKTESESVVT